MAEAKLAHGLRGGGLLFRDHILLAGGASCGRVAIGKLFSVSFLGLIRSILFPKPALALGGSFLRLGCQGLHVRLIEHCSLLSDSFGPMLLKGH